MSVTCTCMFTEDIQIYAYIASVDTPVLSQTLQFYKCSSGASQTENGQPSLL